MQFHSCIVAEDILDPKLILAILWRLPVALRHGLRIESFSWYLYARKCMEKKTRETQAESAVGFISEAASGQCVSQHLPTQFSDHDPSCMGGQVFGLSSRIASSGKGRIFGPSLSAYLAAVSDGKPQNMTNITTMSEIHGFGVLL
jgi:hypothetical protein